MAAAQLPQANVVSILYEQHAQLRDQFGVVPDLHGEYRQGRLRHAARDACPARSGRAGRAASGHREAAAGRRHPGPQRRGEGRRARAGRAGGMDLEAPSSPLGCGCSRSRLQTHFVREEAEEFPAVLGELSEHEQEEMGRWMMRAMALTPSHPHPTLSGSPVGQAVLGPVRLALRLGPRPARQSARGETLIPGCLPASNHSSTLSYASGGAVMVHEAYEAEVETGGAGRQVGRLLATLVGRRAPGGRRVPGLGAVAHRRQAHHQGPGTAGLRRRIGPGPDRRRTRHADRPGGARRPGRPDRLAHPAGRRRGPGRVRHVRVEAYRVFGHDFNTAVHDVRVGAWLLLAGGVVLLIGGFFGSRTVVGVPAAVEDRSAPTRPSEVSADHASYQFRRCPRGHRDRRGAGLRGTGQSALAESAAGRPHRADRRRRRPAHQDTDRGQSAAGAARGRRRGGGRAARRSGAGRGRQPGRVCRRSRGPPARPRSGSASSRSRGGRRRTSARWRSTTA